MAHPYERRPAAAMLTAASHRDPDDRHAEIVRRAYQLYEQRGRVDGSDVDDWLLAEHELMLVHDLSTA